MTDTNVGDNEQTHKDTSYSPASETETEAKQDGSLPASIDPAAAEKVNVAPGTGGPDDVGDIEVNRKTSTSHRSVRVRKRRTDLSAHGRWRPTMSRIVAIAVPVSSHGTDTASGSDHTCELSARRSLKRDWVAVAMAPPVCRSLHGLYGRPPTSAAIRLSTTSTRSAASNNSHWAPRASLNLA